jgi:hypothetical protein
VHARSTRSFKAPTRTANVNWVKKHSTKNIEGRPFSGVVQQPRVWIKLNEVLQQSLWLPYKDWAIANLYLIDFSSTDDLKKDISSLYIGRK